MRQGWNFHGDIAIPLETDACMYYGEIGRPNGKIYEADSIEQGTFVETMILLLRESTHNDCENDEVNAFVRECQPFLGKSGHSIPPEIAQQLYYRFRELFN